MCREIWKLEEGREGGQEQRKDTGVTVTCSRTPGLLFTRVFFYRDGTYPVCHIQGTLGLWEVTRLGGT